MAQQVKNLPSMPETQETWVRSLGWEDPLEEDMATPCTILPWEIPWTEEPGGLQSTGWQVRRGLVHKQQQTSYSVSQCSTGGFDITVCGASILSPGNFSESLSPLTYSHV